MATKDFSFELKALQEAQDAAKAACAAMIAENPDQWYPCGFSWVQIKPARGPLVNALKHFDIGRTSEEGGYIVYNPSGNNTQWMDAKMAGSRAYVEVLKKHFGENYKIKAVERID